MRRLQINLDKNLHDLLLSSSNKKGITKSALIRIWLKRAKNENIDASELPEVNDSDDIIKYQILLDPKLYSELGKRANDEHISLSQYIRLIIAKNVNPSISKDTDANSKLLTVVEFEGLKAFQMARDAYSRALNSSVMLSYTDYNKTHEFFSENGQKIKNAQKEKNSELKQIVVSNKSDAGEWLKERYTSYDYKVDKNNSLTKDLDILIFDGHVVTLDFSNNRLKYLEISNDQYFIHSANIFKKVFYTI
ncbi:MAG: hypothetical protein Q9M91_03730 [Candidatus Dojkabacteria bacterium]|nr:hypothetical protein [Candidatus Dojkabacteria bacterium]MDQ7020925.1 hypothetical protein [Candidatus Dojkabacteria bacterium]